MTRSAAAGVAALALCAAALPAHAQDSERWNWRGTVARGGTLEVRGIQGSIRAAVASGSAVEVTAIKHGDDDPADVRIEVVEGSDGVTICAVYPGRGNSCEPGGGHMNVRHSDVEVDFQVRVPAGVRFEGVQVSGDVEVVGLGAGADASSVSGDVVVRDVDGRVTAHSVSGSVTLEQVDGDEVNAQTVSGDVRFSGPIRDGGRYRFKTLSGDVTVSPDGALNADVSVSTFSGDLDSDYPITMSGGRRHSHRNSFDATIGNGNATLALESFSGTISLRRGRGDTGTTRRKQI